MKRFGIKKAAALLLAVLLCAGCGGAQEKETVADGSYFIDVDSSSSMFRVVRAVLHVEEGEMTADLTLSGKGYLRLFLGTGEEALQAEESDFYYYQEDAGGAYTYTIPVAALDTEIDCAAWSIRKEKWYDRVLVFAGDTLRPWVEDGTYEAEIALEGGSGRSTVLSPTKLLRKNGELFAVVEWSSPYYDYMIVGEEKYLPVNAEGNSVFEIPVETLDEPITVIADTVAMSTPHEIEYTLTVTCEELQ